MRNDLGKILLDIGAGLGYNRHDSNTYSSLGKITYQYDMALANGLCARGARFYRPFTEGEVAEPKRMDELRTL